MNKKLINSIDLIVLLVIVTIVATVCLLIRSAKAVISPPDEECVCSKSNFHWTCPNVEFSKKNGMSDLFLFGSLQLVILTVRP